MSDSENAPAPSPRGRGLRLAAVVVAGAVMLGLPLLLTKPGGAGGGAGGDDRPAAAAKNTDGPAWRDDVQPGPSESAAPPVDTGSAPNYPLDVAASGKPAPPGAGQQGVGGAPAQTGAGPSGSTGGAGPRRRPKKAPARKAAPKPATFSAISGEDCTHSANSGYYRVGTYTKGTTGWYKRSGGWNRNGCKGTFFAVPMSGHRDKADPQAYVVWWFNTGAVKRGSCAVSVYVPKTGSSRDVAGRPAVYQVVKGKTNMGVVRSFTIDQTAVRGRWVSVGSFPVSNGQFAVRLTNRGVDRHREHLGAGQLWTSCRAS